MGKEFERLIKIVKKLRAPNGCPWDMRQTHHSILPFLIEETYEFFEAVDEKDNIKMKMELGDILLQVVFHAQIASEGNNFDIEDVAKAISDKLVQRHPQIFGDNIQTSSSIGLKSNWEESKKNEYGNEKRKHIVSGIPTALPALFRAQKIQQRIASVDFEWENIDRIQEEFRGLKKTVKDKDILSIEDKLGNILFSIVGIAHQHKINAENALRVVVCKYEKRFQFIEDKLKEIGKDIQTATNEDIYVVWNESEEISNTLVEIERND